ncbi:anaerobic ribonucleoside-triphosphate reductase activating protein [Adlercreutzia sp. ZJ141]|uniref:anaerobic ribonucleoside-triphosphate reductase activating protein n=1 Tax=Adlercreutzia sp. ZJ141 TaxID=2709406 RepID=UPI0013E9C6C7|nr:anaerobic ribonucleoside-triphosphate reductase activating protein [Adlercreutzia sp. ZJ141]
MNVNLYGAVPDSIVDGPGLRYAVFVQGCSHGCPGCHNPESQPAHAGMLTTTDAVLADIRANGLVHDVTFSGGEPFEQAAACAHMARQLKEYGYGVWTYTGYLYEDLLRRAEEDEPTRELLNNTDVLVDGPFIESLKSLGLSWRGSSNQRLIDLPATRAAGCIVEWRAPSFVLHKPASW